MRTYKNITFDRNQKIIALMQALSKPGISVDEYRNTFYLLGEALGSFLNKKINNEYGNTMLSCASEDADWLAHGLLNTLSQKIISLSVFWNERIPLNGTMNMDVSTITRSYEEPISDCKTLIIVKSIISTSCVVRTQIMHLINKIDPQVIYIVAPVMFKGAEKCLSQEFPDSIAAKFKFLTFAIDTEKNGNNITPGVGGLVYPKLGLGDSHQKNKYIPNLVKERMTL